jgi:hypothetical protein
MIWRKSDQESSGISTGAGSKLQSGQCNQETAFSVARQRSGAAGSETTVGQRCTFSAKWRVSVEELGLERRHAFRSPVSRGGS